MNIYDFKAIDQSKAEVSLKQYEGKILLIINSATECGFTPQYEQLEALYEKYEAQGFVILDFPCNQFGNQAPGSNEEIAHFCTSRYGVKFPVFSKIEVNGENAHELYKFLISEYGFGGFDENHPLTSVLDKMLSEKDPDYKNDPSIKWNFTKFLINRKGDVVERYEPTTDIRVIEDKIRELL